MVKKNVDEKNKVNNNDVKKNVDENDDVIC